MKTKDKILEILISTDSNYISGEEIATKLGLSRNAVWKQIQTLKSEGYDIISHTPKGYLLNKNTNKLCPHLIALKTNKQLDFSDIHIFDTLASTNQTAKEMAVANAKTNSLIIANTQTAGKGKMGKHFFSPSDTGIYMSFIIRPNITIYESTLLTAATAVAVTQAIENTCKLSPKIKWVNDIYINGKKACGILTEAATDFENGIVDYIIIGIGINCYTKLFPPSLLQSATSLFTTNTLIHPTRNDLIAEIFTNLAAILTTFPHGNFIQTYKEKSFLTNKIVTLADNTEVLVLGIDDDCRLIIKHSSGQISHLHSGDIQLGGNL
ncbi:MAG: biotin--[acetyl-CoA-carboxylase] ligase [Culicoidibacterales bacterium]